MAHNRKNITKLTGNTSIPGKVNSVWIPKEEDEHFDDLFKEIEESNYDIKEDPRISDIKAADSRKKYGLPYFTIKNKKVVPISHEVWKSPSKGPSKKAKIRESRRNDYFEDREHSIGSSGVVSSESNTSNSNEHTSGSS